jgi:hypothetical protein
MGGFPVVRSSNKTIARTVPAIRRILAPPAVVCAFLLLVSGPIITRAQVITIDTSGKGTATTSTSGPVDHQFQQIKPTHIDLPTAPLNEKTRLEVIRLLQAEQGFAMRPLPKGHKGLTLEANGNLEPAGEAYLNMVTNSGISSKPGERVVITNVRFDKDRIIFDFNGGPDPKHSFLRHIEIGAGPGGDTNPVVADQGPATGSRITLTFKGQIPDVDGATIKKLLEPLISFDVKSPIQAYTDTLPASLKDAIMGHQVLVGMNTDMVMYAKGQPVNKIREMDGQMPIEIWLYGAPPEDVTFVRINGNRVIRVELAKVGKPVQVFDTDVVTPMLQANGQTLPTQEAKNVKVVKEGDVQRDPDKQAPAPPPSLGAPTDPVPGIQNQGPGAMKPVHFPTKKPDAQPGANPDDQESDASPQPATQQPATAQGTPAPGGTDPSK